MVVEGDGGVDLGVVPGRLAAADCAQDGGELIHGRGEAVAEELPGVVRVWASCRDGEGPVDVEGGAASLP